MPRTAYVNGRYLPFGEAGVHVEDRGLQFADAVYEVIAIANGVLADLGLHMDRLDRSLAELQIAGAPSRAALIVAIRETVRRNRVDFGFLYLQVGRGAAKRDHAFPAGVKPSIVITCRPMDVRALAERQKAGIAIATMADERWQRPDIKTVSLLPNVLAKQKAREAGAFEAWLVDADGFVTEGSSTNAWIVTDGKTLVTRPLSNAILPGITRALTARMAGNADLTVEERPFTVEEAKDAKEAFLTSTSGGPVPVVRIDGQSVGNGAPGAVTERLIGLYRDHLAGQTRDPARTLSILSGA